MDITASYGLASRGSIPLRPAKVYGSVDEWFKSAVLKTADSKGSVSSNLTASAILMECWPSWSKALSC